MIIYFSDVPSDNTLAGGVARRDWNAVPRIGDEVSIYVHAEIFSGRVSRVTWNEWESSRETGFKSVPYVNVTLIHAGARQAPERRVVCTDERSPPELPQEGSNPTQWETEP